MKFYDGFLSYLHNKRANTAAIFALSWSILKKPSWESIILHILAITSSSRDEKHCQILKITFVVITTIETYREAFI